MILETEDAARAYVASLCDAVAMARLDRFVAMLCSENTRQNLIARNTVANIWQRHVADSAQLLRFVSHEAGSWLDLGTGAGFPGMVLAILRPDQSMVMIESRRKRIDWLEHCIAELALGHCRVLGDRLEKVDAFSASVITARAFAPLDDLLRLSSRFSTAETLWLLPKGRGAKLELETLPIAMREMFHVEHSLTDAEAGIIVGRLAKQGRIKAGRIRA